MGEDVGQIEYAVIEAVVGTKGAGLAFKGLKTGAQVGANVAKGLIGAERLAQIAAKSAQVLNRVKFATSGIVRVGRRIEFEPNTLGTTGGNLRLRPPNQLSRAAYEKLRANSPSPEIREMVNDGVRLPMDDPALPGLKVTKPLHADHIVSMKRISQMDGFSELSYENQLKVLNNRENYIGLSETANTSKGSKTFAEWTEYKKGGVKVDEQFRQRMIQRENELQQTLQQQINDLRRAQNGGR